MLSSTGRRIGWSSRKASPQSLAMRFSDARVKVVDVIRVAEAAPAAAVDQAIDAAVVRHADLGAAIGLQHTSDLGEQALRLRFVLDDRIQDHAGKKAIRETRRWPPPPARARPCRRAPPSASPTCS